MNTFADGDRYTLRIEVVCAGEYDEAFLHLDVHDWNKTTLKMLQMDLEDILSHADSIGMDRVGFYVHEDVGTKFHNMVKPVDYEVPISGKENFLVAGWLTKEM